MPNSNLKAGYKIRSPSARGRKKMATRHSTPVPVTESNDIGNHDSNARAVFISAGLASAERLRADRFLGTSCTGTSGALLFIWSPLPCIVAGISVAGLAVNDGILSLFFTSNFVMMSLILFNRIVLPAEFSILVAGEGHASCMLFM